MSHESVLTGAALDAALVAMDEGRLWWRVGDQYGRSCNGGEPYRLPPASPGTPGEWAPRVDRVRICSRGYHVTSDPIRWAGCAVRLVEVEGAVEREGDKAVCHTLRELGQALPWECVDKRMWAAMTRPFLRGADLRDANLRGADLRGAGLAGAKDAKEKS